MTLQDIILAPGRWWERLDARRQAERDSPICPMCGDHKRAGDAQCEPCQAEQNCAP